MLPLPLPLRYPWPQRYTANDIVVITQCEGPRTAGPRGAPDQAMGVPSQNPQP